MKIVVNKCFGGFGLSTEAYEWLIKEGIPVSKDWDVKGRVIIEIPEGDRSLGKYYSSYFSENRNDELLVKCVEELGSKANGICADLVVVDVPETYYIDEYDGNESVYANKPEIVG